MLTINKEQVFICGMHEKSLRTMEWDRSDTEYWGLAHHKVRAAYYDRLFESHSPEIVDAHCPYHFEMMKRHSEKAPIYSPWEWPEDMNVTTIPHEAFDNRMFWESSIAFPMAIAMASGVKKIGLYGIEMSNSDERIHQKHSMLYQIGLAEGMGIDVHIAPQHCTLFKSMWTGGIYGNPKAVDDMKYMLF